MEPRGSFFPPSLTGERPCSLAVVGCCGSETDGSLALMSEELDDGEGSSCVGLRETLLVLLLVGGGGGAGLGFCNFPLSLTDPESTVCFCLRALLSSAAAPKAGNTFALRSSACSAFVLELSSPASSGLLTTLGVNAWGLEPGLGSESLAKMAEQISGEVFRRGGGVRVPIRRVFSPFCSPVLLRGKAGFPPKVPESKWRCPRSRGNVTDFHSVPSEPVGILEDQRKRFELDMDSSSLGGVVAAAAFPPGPGTAGAPFFQGNKGPGKVGAPLVMPTAPLLLVTNNFVESRPWDKSLIGTVKPLLKQSLSRGSGIKPLLSWWVSISLKEELRLGGVGAFFFFFLMRPRRPLRVLSLSFGSKRSSSFKLLSRRRRSFLGSMGEDTAPSGSTGSEEKRENNPNDKR